MHGIGETMRYLSLFSGIEAASVAWHPLGWDPVAFAEVEPFPSAVLAERFPNVPNFGDVTKFKEWNIDGSIDLIVGGSPCQSFSVAGLRKGMDDPRGNLALTYLAIVEKYRPEWIVWENVPGVLSSNGGRDFGSFLGALDEIGYGYAWRVLDAQYVRTPDYPRAVPQRRRRVFVVGNLRDWRRAAAVLFDSESLCGNPPPSRKKRQDPPTYVGEGIEGDSRLIHASAVSTVDAKNKIDRGDTQHAERMIVESTATAFSFDSLSSNSMKSANPISGCNEVEVSKCLDTTNPEPSKNQGGIAVVQSTATAFKIRGGSEVETGEQGGTPGRKAGKGYLGSDELAFTVASVQDQNIYCYENHGTDSRITPLSQDEPSPTVAARWGTGGNNQALVQQMTYERHDQDGRIKEIDIAPTIHSKADNACDLPLVQAVAFEPGSIARNAGPAGEESVCPTLRSNMGDNQPAVRIEDALPLKDPKDLIVDAKRRQNGIGYVNEPSFTLRSQIIPGVCASMQVRRLTPLECERLQGFPDNWTQIPWRKKSAEDCPDGPRYKAIGNSMAVNVMQWIGLRIALVTELEYAFADANNDSQFVSDASDALDGRAY